MNYSRVIAEFYGQIWAIREETLIAMQDLLRHQAAGIKWTPEEIRERIAAANAASGFQGHEGTARFVAQDKFDDAQESLPMVAAGGKRNAAGPGSVAVIPMIGTISHRMSMMSEVSGGGGGSTQALTAQFRQALNDTNCKAIVFDVDSPGGSVEGVIELAQEIFNARKQKPITAVCNSMAASAAYWLASAASEVVCTPSGLCGSIGVFMLVQDVSEALKTEGVKINLIKAGKFKAEGHPTQPLSDDAREFLQSQVDGMYSTFVKAVAQQRGTSQGAVREGYGQGRALFAAEAVKAGLADRVGTLDDVLAKYGVKTGSRPSSQASAEEILHGDDAAVPKVKADIDEDEDVDTKPPCGCACDACKACSGTAAKAKADDMSCACACDACKACASKSAAKSAADTAVFEALARARRRRLQLS
jgi:signal peptide peptidase SppA